MPDDFDPYRKWLGISDPQRPPNYYRLLGLDLFESDPDVISNAADRQMAHVRTFQTSQHGALSQRLLNELAAARVGLLSPEKKAAYDATLRAEAARQQPPAPPPVAASAPRPKTTPAPAAPPRSVPVKAAPSVEVQPISAGVPLSVVIAAVALVVLLAVVAVGMLLQSRSPTVAQTTSPPSAAAPLVEPLPAETVESPKNVEPEPSSPQPPADQPPPPTESEPQPPLDAPRTPADMPADQVPTIPPSDPAAPEEPATAPPPPTPPAETPPPVEPAAPTRRPVPSDDEQNQARALLREVYAAQLDAATEPPAKLLLADDLSQRAGEEQTAPAERYVLLDEALKLALAAGDGRAALDRLADLATQFELDPAPRRLEILEALQTSARSTDDRVEVAELALALADEAADALAIDHALALADLAKRAAARARDGELNKRVSARRKELDDARTRIAAASEARAAIERDPHDAQAQLTWGLFLCLERDDWSVGLAHLALGADETIRAAAALELAGADTPEKQAALGDSWWEASAAGEADHQGGLRARAEHWYRAALPGLNGLTKAKVEARLTELGGDTPKPGKSAARDAIVARLERAKREFDATRERLRELMLAELKRKGALAEQARKKDEYDAAQREFEAFRDHATLPNAVPPAYESGQQLARGRMNEAYARAVQSLSKAHFDDDAAAVRAEYARWRAPEDAKEHAGRFYKCFSGQLTWHEAVARCAALGGHLVIIRDEQTHKLVAELVEAAGCQAVWLGASDEAKEGDWVWVDGSRMEFANWAADEPKKERGGDDYLVLSLAAGKRWQGHPEASDLAPGYVCEWD